MDAIRLLKDDHQTVNRLFQELERETADARKRQIGTRILDELEVHTQIEEEIFYPAVRELPDEKAHDMINEAYEEHRLAKDLIGELRGREPHEDMFDAQFKVLKENIEHHVQEEEGEMFPHIRPLMKDRLAEIGANMQRRKRELQSPPTSVTGTIRGLMTRAYEAVAGSEPARSGAKKRAGAKAKGARTAARARKSSRTGKTGATSAKRTGSKKRAATKRAKRGGTAAARMVAKSARSARSNKSARNSKRAGAVASGARKRSAVKATPAKRARARRASRSAISRRR